MCFYYVLGAFYCLVFFLFLGFFIRYFLFLCFVLSSLGFQILYGYLTFIFLRTKVINTRPIVLCGKIFEGKKVHGYDNAILPQVKISLDMTKQGHS